MATEAEQAFYSAVSFHEASLRCAGGGPPVDLQLPMICCTAFASELYMKALVLRREPGRIKDHNLFDLYTKKLLPDERSAIALYYGIYTREGEAEMLDDLKVNAEAFVEWRYAHEGPRLSHLTSLTTFARAAYLAVQQLIPEWTVAEGLHERITADDDKKVVLIIKPEDQADMDQKLAAWLQRFRIVFGPETYVAKSEKYHLPLARPMLNFYGQTATLNAKIRWRSNS